MKAKYLIMASLILAVFTISAVCASQDIIDDNNITATDEAEDSLSESPVKEIVSTEENNQILEAEPTDFKVNITEEINASQENWENQTLASVYCSEDAEGVSMLMTSPGGSQSVIGGSYSFNIDAGQTVNVTCDKFYMAFIRYMGNYDIIVKYNDGEIARQTITITKDIKNEDFQYRLFSSDYSYSEDVIQFVPILSGNLTVFVNGAERHNRHYERRDPMLLGNQVCINKTELGLTTPGEYRISARYTADDCRTFDFKEDTYLVGEEYVRFIDSEIDLNTGEMQQGIYLMENTIAVIEDSQNITGTVTVTINGNEVYRKLFTGNESKLEIKNNELDFTGVAFGSHAINVTYNRNDADEHSLERTSLIYESPTVYIPYFMFEGENEAVIVTASKNYTGTVSLLNSIYGPMSPDSEVISSAEIINGTARISVENLPNGEYYFFLNISIDQLPAMESLIRSVPITVKDNPTGYESDITSTAINPEGEVTVTLNGNVSDETVYVFVDGIPYPNVSFDGDVATTTIRNLAVGKHYITIKRYDPLNFEEENAYSNTFVVDVVTPIDPNLSIRVSDTIKGNGAVVEIFANDTLTGTVNVKLNTSSTVYPVDVIEGYGTTTIDDLDAGSYLASAAFEGNAYFNPDTDDAAFSVEDFIITIANEINLDDENIENIPIVTIYCPKGAQGDDIYFVINNELIPDFLKISLKENLGKTVNVTIRNSNQGFKYIGSGNFTIKALIDWTEEIGSGSINITRAVSKDNFEFVTYTESNHGWVIDFRTTPLNGNLTVLVNGAERYNEYLEKYGPCPTLKSQDLGIDTPGEENEISVKFISEDGVTYDLAKFNYFQCSEHILIRDIDNYNNNLEIVKIMDSPVKGNVTVLFDGKTIYSKHLDSYVDENIMPYELDFKNITYGTHKLFVNYTKDNGENYTLERNILVYETPRFNCPDFIIEGENAVITFTAQKEYTGKISLTLNQGMQKLLSTVDLVNGSAVIMLENFAKGQYKLIYTCAIDQIPNRLLGRGFTLTVKEKTDAFRVEINATAINLGDWVKATFYSDISNLNGTVSSFINGKRYRSVDLTAEGKADIIFDNLTVGDNYLHFEFVDTTGSHYYSDTLLVKVINNVIDVKIDPNLRITVKSVHKSEKPVIEIRTNAGFTGKVTVKIGSKSYEVNVIKGKGTKTISTLKVGTYTAKATLTGTEVFKSATKSVKFKVTKDVIKLTIKKVKVKKSAKKLKITATLKINGKKVKGKKLTFKFNKKTYKAKTNKKGVAQITIKKNVLKKLKVGKKIKYQVSYGGKTVKRTVKVKR